MSGKRFFLAVLVAVASMASTASTAAAQHTVEVLKEGESGGEPCGPFALSEHRPVEGDCTVQFSGAMEIYVHNGLSEVLVSECDYEFEAVFNSIGFGYIYDQVMTPEGGACNREPCDESGAYPGPGVANHRNLAWPAQINESGVAGTTEAARVVLCVRGPYSDDPATEGVPGSWCAVDFALETAGHSVELATPADFQGNGGAPCVNFNNAVELEGSFATETNEDHPDDIEVVHLDD
jgi:hypothetical protein